VIRSSEEERGRLSLIAELSPFSRPKAEDVEFRVISKRADLLLESNVVTAIIPKSGMVMPQF